MFLAIIFSLSGFLKFLTGKLELKEFLFRKFRTPQRTPYEGYQFVSANCFKCFYPR